MIIQSIVSRVGVQCTQYKASYSVLNDFMHQFVFGWPRQRIELTGFQRVPA